MQRRWTSTFIPDVASRYSSGLLPIGRTVPNTSCGGRLRKISIPGRVTAKGSKMLAKYDVIYVHVGIVRSARPLPRSKKRALRKNK